MPNLSRSPFSWLASGFSALRRARRQGLARAAALAAAPVALVVIAGAGPAAAGPAGGGGTSPFPVRAAGTVTRTAAHGEWPPGQGPGINWALSGQASADTSQT